MHSPFYPPDSSSHPKTVDHIIPGNFVHVSRVGVRESPLQSPSINPPGWEIKKHDTPRTTIDKKVIV